MALRAGRLPDQVRSGSGVLLPVPVSAVFEGAGAGSVACGVTTGWTAPRRRADVAAASPRVRSGRAILTARTIAGGLEGWAEDTLRC